MTQRNQGWALLATSLGFGVVQLDVSVVNVAITPIGADLGGGIGGVQWVVNAYTVAFGTRLRPPVPSAGASTCTARASRSSRWWPSPPRRSRVAGAVSPTRSCWAGSG